MSSYSSAQHIEAGASCQIAFTSIRLNQISAYSISIAIFPRVSGMNCPGFCGSFLPFVSYENLQQTRLYPGGTRGESSKPFSTSCSLTTSVLACRNSTKRN